MILLFPGNKDVRNAATWTYGFKRTCSRGRSQRQASQKPDGFSHVDAIAQVQRVAVVPVVQVSKIALGQVDVHQSIPKKLHGFPRFCRRIIVQRQTAHAVLVVVQRVRTKRCLSAIQLTHRTSDIPRIHNLLIEKY